MASLRPIRSESGPKKTWPIPSPRKRAVTTYWTSFWRGAPRSRPIRGSAGSIASMASATSDIRRAARGMNSPVRSLPSTASLPLIAPPSGPWLRIPWSLPLAAVPCPDLRCERAWYYPGRPWGRALAFSRGIRERPPGTPARNDGRNDGRMRGRRVRWRPPVRSPEDAGPGDRPATGAAAARRLHVSRRGRTRVRPRAMTDRISIATNAR